MSRYPSGQACTDDKANGRLVRPPWECMETSPAQQRKKVEERKNWEEWEKKISGAKGRVGGKGGERAHSYSPEVAE